jgi:hypothetical protein
VATSWQEPSRLSTVEDVAFCFRSEWERGMQADELLAERELECLGVESEKPI